MNMNLYSKRRAELLDQLEGGIAVLKGAPQQIRTHDTEYPYRQDSDFYYLTGYAEPGAAMIIDPNNRDAVVTLFVLPRDPAKEVWTGWRLDFDETRERYGVDRVLDIAEFEPEALKAMQAAKAVYSNLSHDRWHNYRMLDMVRQSRAAVQRNGGGPDGIISIGRFTHEMRLRKSPAELDLMRKAAVISAEAHCLAMQAVQPGMYEYELQAVIEGHFMRNGGTWSYESIVGAGKNATVLHYVRNDSLIADGDLVLIDAGAEYEYYAADITRTFPANGRFDGAQKALYEVVLNAQQQVVDAARPGITFQALHDLDLKLLVDGMIEVGLIQSTPDEVIEHELYKPFFMHKTGHWLGMDVHDLGNYRKDDANRILEPGMVFTVEPGIYVQADADVDAAFRGIGIRIEDDIHITADGNENLTLGVPKGLAEIEELMAS